MKVSISQELKTANPGMALGVMECRVQNTAFSDDLWREIAALTAEIRNTLTFDSIKEQPQIAATRRMYTVCGKDPSRYRPSAEALMRRIVKGNDLYQINTMVDLVNLVSMRYGYSIGGFDADKVEGDVVAGIGREGEPYNGIGRGPLNIAGLPVLRDAVSGFGTPTSDEERTAMSLETSHFLMVVNAYDGPALLPELFDYTRQLLEKYAAATDISTNIIE
ncbi:MAG: hypothetical protein IKW86_02885 [Salinivirgaceae bacterium]|nr:hypothetical protein [Salinivirgaceae bacterium]